MDGLLFGFIDNAVLLVGAYTGFEVEKVLPKRFQVGVGAIAGAGIGNINQSSDLWFHIQALFR